MLSSSRFDCVDRGVAAPAKQEAMACAASIIVKTDDLAGGVDPSGIGQDRAGMVQRGVAAPAQQEAVGGAARSGRSC